MRTKLPISLYDLGAAGASDLDFSRKKLWSRMKMRMGDKALDIPVYLASRKQMDRLAPPGRFCYLDPEQVAQWARRLRQLRKEQDQKLDRKPLEGLDPQCDGPYRDFVAAGLYVPQPPSAKDWNDVLNLADPGTSPSPEAHHPPSGPAIFLCPERILDWADETGLSRELILDQLYYHELGHALMDTGVTPYNELWGRIIEESLANWITFSRFEGQEAVWIQRIIKGEPAEYRGYAHLEEALLSYPKWREMWEYFWHHWDEGAYAYFRYKWEEWEKLARQEGWPPSLLPFSIPTRRGDRRVSRMVYEAWRKAKRDNMDEGFWAVYAENILLETFA